MLESQIKIQSVFFLAITRSFPLAFPLALSLALAGCKSAAKRPTLDLERDGGTALQGPPEPFGPSRGSGTQQQGSVSPTAVVPGAQGAIPSAVPTGPTRGIILVLGPGGAKSFAHAGVLKALSESKTPIAAIVATDIGAMIAAIHFASPSFNAFEWEIQKMKPALFEDEDGPRNRSDKEINSFLKQSLGKKDFGNLPYAFRVCVSDEDNRAIAFLSQGSLSVAVRAAMAGRGALKPIQVAKKGGPLARSCTASRPIPIAEARTVLASGGGGSGTIEGPVVLVNVLPQKKFRDYSDDEIVREQEIEMDRTIDLIQAEKNTADVLIEPDLNGISVADFAKKSEAAYRGKNATLLALPRIVELLGTQEK